MNNIGKFNRRIELRRSYETGRQTSGEPIIAWQTYATVWAHVGDIGGREFFAAQQINDEISSRVTIRYRSDVVAKDMVRIGEQDYDIVAPVDRQGDRRWLELMCRRQPKVLMPVMVNATAKAFVLSAKVAEVTSA